MEHTQIVAFKSLEQQIEQVQDLLLVCFVCVFIVLAAIAYLITNIHDRP